MESQDAPGSRDGRGYSPVTGPRVGVPPWLPAAICAAALSLFRLTERPLRPDEKVSLRLATSAWDEFADRVLQGDQLFGALYYGLLRVWSTLGEDPFTIRLLSVLLAAATVPLAYVLAQRLFNPRVALLASALLALNPFFIRYAQDARAYSLVLCLVTLASYLLLRALDRPVRVRWLAYGVAATAAAFAHLFAVFVLLVHVGVILWRRSGRGLVVAGAVSALVAPFTIVVLLEGPERLFVPHMRIPMVRIAVDRLAGGLGQWPPIHGIVYGLFAAPAVLVWRPRAPISFCAAWLIVPIALAAALSLAKPMFVVRYLIVVLPAFMILVAVTVTTIKPRAAMAAALGVLVALSATGLAWWYFSPPAS
jgi:mannosyltransferase